MFSCFISFPWQHECEHPMKGKCGQQCACRTLWIRPADAAMRRQWFFLSSLYYPVEFLSLLNCPVTEPERDTVSENALNSASIKQRHGWNRELHPLQPVEKVKALLGLRDDSCGVVSGGQLIRQMYPKELGAMDPLHLWLINNQLEMVLLTSPSEVCCYLLFFFFGVFSWLPLLGLTWQM